MLNTLFRWFLTVRGLRPSRLAMAAFVVAARDQVQDVELARRERGEVGTGCAGGLGPWGLDVATERAGRPGRLTDQGPPPSR